MTDERRDGRRRIVIVGGGFAGLYAARRLGRLPVDVTLIDRRNFHLFQPLLYQVATGGLSPGDIASPLRGALSRYRNVSVLQGTVTDVDPGARTVKMDGRPIPWDDLLIAVGGTLSYFGHDDWRRHAPGLKTVEDALEMRRRILSAFERAEGGDSAMERSRLQTVVIVGGGPTGVELAGAVAELAYQTLRNDFRRIDPGATRIILVEAGDRVLGAYPEDCSRAALETLSGMGVEIRLHTTVAAVENDAVYIATNGSEERIATETVLWGAGIRAVPLADRIAQRCGAGQDRAGRIRVDEHLSIPGHPSIMVLGDVAHVRGPDGGPLPGVAQVAMQQGRYAADRIELRLAGRDSPPFRYRDKGSLAVIGRNRAVADIGRFNMSGFPAWLVWVFIHIAYLIEFDNKILVLFQWAYNYFTRKRGARLITEDGAPFLQPDGETGVTETPADPSSAGHRPQPGDS